MVQRFAHIMLKVSKDPYGRALGPKCYNINGIGALQPYYLDPWTLNPKH